MHSLGKGPAEPNTNGAGPGRHGAYVSFCHPLLCASSRVETSRRPGCSSWKPILSKNQSVISKHMIQEYVQDLRGP